MNEGSLRRQQCEPLLTLIKKRATLVLGIVKWPPPSLKRNRINGDQEGRRLGLTVMNTPRILSSAFSPPIYLGALILCCRCP